MEFSNSGMDSVRDFKTFFPYTAFKGITHFKPLYQVFFLNKEKHKWPLNFEWIVHNTSKHQCSFFLLSSKKKIPLLSSLKVNFSLKKKKKRKKTISVLTVIDGDILLLVNFLLSHFYDVSYVFFILVFSLLYRRFGSRSWYGSESFCRILIFVFKENSHQNYYKNYYENVVF